MSTSERTAEFANQIAEREVAPNTARRYGRWARRYEAWRPGGDPDAEELRNFDTLLEDEENQDYPWQNARGKPAPPSYAFQTRVSALSGVKLWLEFQYDTRIEKEVQKLAVGEPAPFDPTILEPQEIERVIRDAPTACDVDGCQTAIRVAYNAILRGAELADARTEDLDRDDRTLYVRAVKGSEPTHIALSNQAWTAVRKHADRNPDREYLFHNAYDNPWSAAAWNQHFRRKHHEAGSHAFCRHSAISNRLKQGEDFGQVFLRSRHQQPATTLKYVDQAGVSAPDWAE